jgi:hypothetical protein
MTEESCESLNRFGPIRFISMTIGHSEPRIEEGEFEYTILVTAKVQSESEMLCAELVPYAASYVRKFRMVHGRVEKETLNLWQEAMGDNGTEPWACEPGDLNAGRFLHLDWPVQIYYRREFPCIGRSQPHFVDDELDSEYDDPTGCTNLIRAELENHDVVLWDRPACSLAPGEYVKYEFQSAYLLRDPRPGRRDEQVGYRRFVVFVYGTVDRLEMTQTRPPDWDQDWA